MKTMGRDAIAIVAAAPVPMRNNDVEFAYRQDSYFHYLTGFGEPESVAVLIPGRPQGEYLLFVRDRDPARETWDGRRAGPVGARRDHSADDAFPIDDIDEILPGLLEGRSKLYYSVGHDREFDQRVVGWVNRLRAEAKQGRHAPHEMVALEHVLNEMRLFKSRGEIERMREAARIAATAHVRAMRFCRPGRFEYEVEAELRHEFARWRADISYLPIVGGGANGCILHYRENESVLNDGDLLLIDAGCEYQTYASDITRTFPVNGRFSAAQRAAYDVVLEANLAAIDAVRVGNDWNRPHEVAVEVLTAGYDPAAPVSAWALAIARHKLVDLWRRRGRREGLHDPIDDVAEHLLAAEPDDGGARRDLAVLLQGLPPAQRHAIELTKLEGLSVAEAAQRTGASESAIKVQVHRGLKRLAALVRGLGV